RRSTSRVCRGRPRRAVASPPMSAWRIDRAANASESRSTARNNSPEKGPLSGSMACDELPDGLLRQRLLFFGVLLGPSRRGRDPQDQGSGVQEVPKPSELLLRRQRPEPRRVFENDIGLARELDGKVHRRLLDQGCLKNIVPIGMTLMRSSRASPPNFRP